VHLDDVSDSLNHPPWRIVYLMDYLAIWRKNAVTRFDLEDREKEGVW